MEETKRVRCVRWCQRCGGDLCFSARGTRCLECGAVGRQVLYSVKDIRTRDHDSKS